MKVWKHMSFLLFFFTIGCNEQKESLTQSIGDMAISGQKMLDVVVTPDKINGTLFITSQPNDQIINLSGTSNYENLIGVSHTKIITGDLWIRNNNELSDLSPLDSLTTIGKSIMIKNNPKIFNLDFISDLKEFNGIELRQIGISNLDFIKSVKKINGWLGLQELNNLKVFTNLEIERVRGLSLDSLEHMTNTDFLNNLNRVTDAIYLKRNPNLKQISLMIANTNLNGNLNISSNKLLTEINGLDQIQTINKELMIIDNESLTNLDFIKGVKHVNGSIRIRGNSNLIDFSGLSNIQSVKGAIQIEDNGVIDAKAYGQILEWRKKWKAGANK